MWQNPRIWHSIIQLSLHVFLVFFKKGFRLAIVHILYLLPVLFIHSLYV